MSLGKRVGVEVNHTALVFIRVPTLRWDNRVRLLWLTRKLLRQTHNSHLHGRYLLRGGDGFG